jgi:hypothetical protein
MQPHTTQKRSVRQRCTAALRTQAITATVVVFQNTNSLSTCSSTATTVMGLLGSDELPDDVVLQIAAFMSARDLCQLARVSRRFAAALSADSRPDRELAAVDVDRREAAV